MKETYKEKINRNTDWGGDASTGNLPVAGSRVQEFIKEELNSKIGAVYKPDGGNVVYYFANEDDKQAFIETEDMSLVLSYYETESKYEVKINQDGLVLSHSVIDGTTGNTISFEFKIEDDNGMAADSKARVELSFTGSGISNKFTNEVAVVAGDWTRYTANIDEYLRTGANSIAIRITGMSTKANTQFVMTYNLFDLSFVVNFEYNKAKTGNTISVPYIIECSDTKYLEFFIDGVKVDSSESMVITDIRRDSTATLSIANLALGQHSLQVRAYVKSSDGTLFYTPTYFYTFAKEGNAETSFLMSILFEDGTHLIAPGNTLSISLAQFEQIMFDWSTYDYAGRKLVVYFEYDGRLVSSSVVYENGSVNTFSYRPMEDGDGKILRIYSLDDEDQQIFEYVINVDVAETSSGIKEATEGLLLKLQSIGRRNTDSNRDVWSCIGSDGNEYHADFSGFTWNTQQGWDDNTESLVISNGAFVTFNIQPMINNWAVNGGTVEIDLETFDIENEDAVICECANKTQENEAYFRITATKAEFATSNGVSINTRYKDNERLKIAFIGNRAGDHDDGYLIYIVVNGVLERAALYKTGDSLFSFANLSIGDPTGQCKVRLRSIRVYNKAISVDEAFNNYVVDSDDVQGIYEKNNVLKAGSATEIGFDEVANKLPVMIFTGDMDDIVNNGQDKEWRNFDVEYINRQEPERNFVSFNCQMKLQGTSSLGYPRKNFKLKTKDKNFNQEIYDNGNFELDPNSVVGNLMLRDKRNGQTIDFDDFKTNGRLRNSYCYSLDYEGKALKKGKYRFRADAHKATKWTLKADFMESSCSHNVGAGRSWNDIFENTDLRDNGDASYTNQTYKDSALVNRSEYIEYNGYNIEGTPTHYKIPNNTPEIIAQKKYVCRTDAQKQCIAKEQDDVRTAVDGFPMVCFYRRNHAENNLIFLGQYNFINDKGSYEVFGFEDIEDPDDEETMIYDASKVECWEGLKNTNPLSLFKTIDGFYDWNADGSLRKWAETYEARYPDPEDYEQNPEALYELSKWIVSTRHEDDTQYSGTLDIDASFAKRINTYQYGYTDDTASSYQYAEGSGLVDNAENRQKKFETEKWEHFDVWKLAGYYVYLMRYGAVDQFVKNTMLFTDGNGRYDPRTDKKYRKWFFINYDNDCLFGLRNNGQLAFHWDLNRQTIDAASDIIDDDQADDEGADTNAYAMMGHDSTLWNNLERDDEFMRMVRDLDYSMSKCGLNYDNMVTEFDTKQTEQWCERIYNANERYKYIDAAKGIGDMAGKAVDNLWMLQGTRRSHRHWWIANHFNLLDAQWLSGDYKNTYVEIKTNCLQGDTIHAVAGAKYYYAWGQQKKIYESNMQRNEGETIDFSFPTNQSQGDPVYIYAFNKMTEMDFSDLARFVYEGSFKFVLGNDLVQNNLKKLVIGNPNVVNRMSQDTTTWDKLPNLEYLDITNYEGITYVPLNAFNNLRVFKASGSKLGSFEPADGARFELVELPQTIGTLTLNDISFKNNIFTDLVYTPNTSLNSLRISNNDGVGQDYYNKIVKPWINSIEASTMANTLYQGKSLNISNINWSFSDLNDIRLFKNFSKKGSAFHMSGTIDLRSCGNLSLENIEEIKEIFGENCFNPKMSSLYVITPESVFIEVDKKSMVAGDSVTFKRTIYPDERAIVGKVREIIYYIVEETNRSKQDAGEDIIFTDAIAGKNYLVIDPSTVRSGLTLTNARDENDKQIGILNCDEMVVGSDTTFKVLVYMNLQGGSSSFDKVSVTDFTVKDPTYAVNATITGNKSLYYTKEYRFTLNPADGAGNLPIGRYTVEWTLEGDAVAPYVDSYSVNPDNQLEFNIVMNTSQPEVSSMMTLKAKITNYNGTVVNTNFETLALNENVIMTRDSNPEVMAICYAQRWTDNINAMTKSQAEAVTDFGDAFKGVEVQFEFPEFIYFTGVTSLTAGTFSASNIVQIVLHEGITDIGNYCFDNCQQLRDVFMEDETDTTTQSYIRTLPSQITILNEGVFRGCSSLCELNLPENVKVIDRFALGGTGFEAAILHSSEDREKALRFPAGLETIQRYAFEKERWAPLTTTNKLRRLEIPSGTNIVDYDVFCGRYYEEFVVEEGNINYKVEDGVLVSNSGEYLLRYPPMAPAREEYVLPPVLGLQEYAFFAVKNLGKIYTQPNGTVSTILEGFCMDSNIVEVDISSCNHMSSLPENAFRGCTKLERVALTTSGTLDKIGIAAFSGCTVLEEITIPNGVSEIECDLSGYSNTFVGCNALEEIVFPDSITKLSRYTVRNCRALTGVTFPSYLRCTLSNGANTVFPANFVRDYGYFPYSIVTGCENIKTMVLPAFSYDVTNESGETESVVINKYNEIFLGGPIYFRNAEGGTGSKYGGISIIDGYEGLTTIAQSPHDNGQSITISNNCLFTADMKSLIYGLKTLTSVTIPEGVETIAGYALQSSAISNLKFPSTIKSIGAFAFQYCNNIGDIVLPNGIEGVGEGAFRNSSMTSIEIPDTIHVFPRYAFADCPNLEKVTFKAYCEDRGDGTFDRLQISNFVFIGDRNLKTIIASSVNAAPLITSIISSVGAGGPRPEWYPFNGAGSSVSSDKKLLIPVHMSDAFTEYFEPTTGGTSWAYMTQPGYSITGTPFYLGYELLEEIPLSGYSFVKIYNNEGIEYTASPVYAKSELGHLVGINDEPYSSTYEDGTYMFDLDGLYDNEKITIYSDIAMTTEIGSFYPRIMEKHYQIGEPFMGSRKAKFFSTGIFSATANEDDEIVEITKSEYETLVSRVNQMMRVIKKLTE